MKKTLFLFSMILLLSVSIVGMTIPASSEDTFIQGTWNNLTWELNMTTGNLTISGNGTMRDFTLENDYGKSAWQQNSYRKTIKTVVIEEGVKSISNMAFFDLGSITNITIPDSVTSIGDSAFYWCFNLTSITIPKNVSYIAENALACNGLMSITVAPENPTYHSSGNCIIKTHSKTLITGCLNSIIPDDGSVTSIGTRAFMFCSKLESIAIPNGIISIGESAFTNCNNLTTIALPNSIAFIDSTAFSHCGNLKNVIYCGTQEEWSMVEKENGWNNNANNYKVFFHLRDNEQITKNPTHTEYGEKTFICSVCNATISEIIDKTPAHSFGDWIPYDEDSHKRICDCGEIQYTDHDYSVIAHSAEQHKQTCVCGDFFYSNHVYDNEFDSFCDDCGFINMGNYETSKDENFLKGCNSFVDLGTGLIILLSIGSVGLLLRKKLFNQ